MNSKKFAARWLIVAAVVIACTSIKAVIADISSNELSDQITEVPDVVKLLNGGKTKLTPSLIAWISQQSEGIVEEMESIAKFNAESPKFSVVNYLRYLTLFNHLKVVASKPHDEFRWIARKAKTLARIYDSVLQVVYNYLHDVDQTLRQLEDKEPKSKQVDPSNDWTRNYEIIRFIALHAPSNTDLADAARAMLASSPNGTLDKARSIRYSLKTRAFSR